MSLTEKTCEPCRGGIPPMSRDEAAAYLKDADGWSLSADASRIHREFKFKDFAEALDFVNKVGQLAEDEGHHPDISFGYGYAEVTIFTHKINGLHENDFIMAAKINTLV